MSGRSAAHETVLEQLQTFGLSAYAARTFVALVTLGRGTAQEVSNTVDVPRTRVYDAAEELAERDLVAVTESSPKQFWPISPETAGRQFEREYRQHANVLREALGNLESTPRSQEQRGVWTTTGSEAISERLQRLIRTAETDVVFASSEELLDPAVIDTLSRAQADGLTIKLGEMADPVDSDIRDVLDDSPGRATLRQFERPATGRLAIVDGQRILVSTVVEDTDAQSNGDRSPGTETAVWGDGLDEGVLSVLRVLLLPSPDN
ncbi:TrmB family transcriptional regulator [Halovenus sp. WSH3]|uniref:TrmB family transcriptional regulator n=1 Tax=Halovenus carboxidivorans TaxID=2692199 RepID=A0A6B0TIH3_9EURY|nr:helix-turn-helix domain-containing protein [Halovenus carboxidivorans]MXR53009.1 TrmB family transcriptional regulator [Halovenus carboxidivorans]